MALAASGVDGLADLVTRYEQLREQVLEGQVHGQGLSVLLRQGMRAWIEAWSLCPASTPDVASQLPRAGETVPPPMQREVVLVLAGMALNQRRTTEV